MDLTEAKEKASGLLNKFRDAFSVFLDRIPEGKRRLVIFGLGGLAALFIILVIIAAAANSGKSKKGGSQEMASGPFIPAEDLFFPAEPDFLPQFLLEREPRQSWSLDDIRPYWRNPGNPEVWRGEIKAAVDKLMEGVP